MIFNKTNSRYIAGWEIDFDNPEELKKILLTQGIDKNGFEFIFIGSLDTTDKRFDWINLPRLDIAYPLYECNYGVFLDYSNPQNPEIINPDTFDDSWYDSSTRGLDKVIFKEQRYSVGTDITDKINEDILGNNLLCGVPLWYQAPDIPICPKTGEVMRFVCTINSDSSIDIKDKNGIENLPFGDYLIFGDHGNLFVFFHPDSKVMYLNIQF